MRAASISVVFLAAGLVTSACSGEEPICTTPHPLIDNTQWSVVPLESDPFRITGAETSSTAPPHLGRCDESSMTAEDLGGEMSFSIITYVCGWATVEQTTKEQIRAGDPLFVRLWYYSQLNTEPAEANLLLAFEDEPFWNGTVPLPAMRAGLLTQAIAAPRDVPAGTPIRFHLANHGANSWNLIEVSVQRPIDCAALDGGAAP